MGSSSRWVLPCVKARIIANVVLQWFGPGPFEQMLPARFSCCPGMHALVRRQLPAIFRAGYSMPTPVSTKYGLSSSVCNPDTGAPGVVLLQAPRCSTPVGSGPSLRHGSRFRGIPVLQKAITTLASSCPAISYLRTVQDCALFVVNLRCERKTGVQQRERIGKQLSNVLSIPILKHGH